LYSGTETEDTFTEGKAVRVATIRFMQGISGRNNRLLVRFNIITVHIPVKKDAHLLRPERDTLGLKV
jgi:hypothetical protein